MTAEPIALPAIIRAQAVRRGDAPFLTDAGGTSVTYQEMDLRVRSCVTQLREYGFAPNDVVATLLSSSIDAVTLWAGLSAIGALEVPLNTAYFGEMLERLMVDSGATALIIEPAFVDRVPALTSRLARLQRVIVIGSSVPPAGTAGRVIVTEGIGRTSAPADPASMIEPSPSDTACLMYTSGTTGHSKGVLVPWTQVHATAVALLAELPTDSDCGYIPAPMFHVGGKGPVYLTALTGGRAVLSPAFKTRQFWPDVINHGCTITYLGGAMANFLLDQAGPRRDEHQLRDVLLVPVIPRIAEFCERFGVRVCTAYNMTEVSCPITSGWIETHDGSCGQTRDGYQCRIVDGFDHEVDEGDPGELVVRSNRPWTMFSGYLGRPEATAAAWRNLWFHTGDAFRQVDGKFFFVDRLKDAIRRRGENISSAEVEDLVRRTSGVAEAAAVGVPSQWGEEEILIFVRLSPGVESSEGSLHLDWLARMPSFMVPRYIEIVTDFPRTPNEKILKSELRRRGIGAQTWDSRAADPRGSRAPTS